MDPCRQLEQLAPIGNSPTFMNMEDMRRTMPIWMNTSIAIFKDEEANKVSGPSAVSLQCQSIATALLGREARALHAEAGELSSW